MRITNFGYSILIHSLIIVAILLGTHFLVDKKPVLKGVVIQLIDPSDIVLSPDKKVSGGGGGGGDISKLLASKGKPPKLDLKVITPPTAVIKNSDPKLVVEQAIAVPSLVKLPTSQTQVGDPLSSALAISNGSGVQSGIGIGSNGGIGSGAGRGLGPGSEAGVGGGVFHVGGGVSAPRATYSPEPEYSDEARKVKYAGTVVLTVVVDADGHTRDIRVRHGVGMGLDQKAVDAVRLWRFEPAKKDGRPVAVVVNIEVNFNLY